MSGIEFDVQWVDGPGFDRGLAWGRAILSIGGEPFWFHESDDGRPVPVEWTWVDLLEHLGRFWPDLTLETTYPLGLTPISPLELRSQAARRWDRLQASHEVRLREDELLARFEWAHDLSAALRGISFPPLRVVRHGLSVLVCADRDRRRFAARSFIADLARIGDTIASRLDGVSHPRASAAVEAWRRRDEVRRASWLERVSGLPAAMRHQLGITSAAQLGNPTGDRDDTELAAAARLTGGRASVGDYRRLLDAVRFTQAVATPALDAMSDEALATLAEVGGLDPYEQGYALAAWLRPQVTQGARVDIEALLSRLGVPVHELQLGRNLDAVGIWGPDHGPAVFVNPRGLHAETPAGRRATLAHELCHLLVDRRDALPVAEVLGGLTPYAVERRAGAFAAELLLPRAVAWSEFAATDDFELAIGTLCSKFDVSRTIVARQVLNGSDGKPLGVVEQAQLEDLASYR